MRYFTAAGICAVLLCSLAAVTPASSVETLNRLRRTTSPAVVPQWTCTGDFASDYQSYDVACNTNLEITSVSCTLDGQPYDCSSLQFSVDLSDDDGRLHRLLLTAQARYRGGTARLRYTFTFQIRNQRPLHVNCRAEGSGNDVVVTCTRVGDSQQITSIRYSINGGSTRTATSVSRIRIDESQLVAGENTITLTITGESGTSRTVVLTVDRVAAVYLHVNCSAVPDGYDVVVSCATIGNSEQISSIRYSINGGNTRTASSVSQFRVDGDDLRNGANIISLTITGVSGVSRVLSLPVQKFIVPLSLRCESMTSNSGVLITCNTNRLQSSLTLQCYLDGVLYSPCDLSIFLQSSQLSQERHNFTIIVTDQYGLTVQNQLSFYMPLSLQCESMSVTSGLFISCGTNRQQSSLTQQCYLNGVLQETCDLSTILFYSQLSQGRHNYTIIVRDRYEQTVRNELSFENILSVSCFGLLNLGSDIYSVDCFSNTNLTYTRCVLDGQVVPCPENLNLDISSLSPGQHTLEITGSNEFGSTATATTDFSIPEPIGFCEIESNPYDDVIDWNCTLRQNVSMVCLVDGLPLEDCICVPESEFFIARYPEGNHTVDLILNSDDGVSETFSHNFTIKPLRSSASQAVEPLVFECISQPNNISVIVSCTSNKPVTVDCYLDNILQSSCGMSNVLYFHNLTQGPHNFSVIARDQDGLVGRSDVHFEEDLHLSCRGTYNPSTDIIHIDCDANNPLMITECALDNGEKMLCPTPYDVPVSEFVNDLVMLRVNARDEFGNTGVQELTFSV